MQLQTSDAYHSCLSQLLGGLTSLTFLVESLAATAPVGSKDVHNTVSLHYITPSRSVSFPAWPWPYAFQTATASVRGHARRTAILRDSSCE